MLCCREIGVPAIGVPPRQLGCTVKTGKDWDTSFEVAVVDVGQAAGDGVGISSAVVEMYVMFTADE